MHFPKFWAQGSALGGDSFNIRCWRWSDESQADAQQAADQAAQELAEKARAGQLPRDGYGYPDRPLREEVIREIQPGTVISRNSCGCLVLNTERVMFVDVDIPDLEHAPDQSSFLGRLFGGKSRPELIAPVLEKARTFAVSSSGWGWRIYATRAGLRLVATHALFATKDRSTQTAFEQLGADPLYRRLCDAQDSFRARLTPKPWRCHLEPAPVRWPFETDGARATFDRWESEYLRTAGNFATCQFLGQFGAEAVHPEIAPVIQVHDEITNADANLGLA